MNVCCNFIHNCLNMEETQVYFIRQLIKEIVVHLMEKYSVLERNEPTNHEDIGET